jgi:hypothetical protein
MKIFYCIIFCTLFSVTLYAQKKYNFHSQNYIGLVEGSDGGAFQLQTINGIQKSNWFAGIGAGLDYYLFRSIPLFLSLNKNFTKKNRTFFLSLDGGTNFTWYKREETMFSNLISSKFIPAAYWGAGIGYKIGLSNKKDALIFNAGYSLKKIKEEREMQVICVTTPCNPFLEKYVYNTKRISIRVGWQF